VLDRSPAAIWDVRLADAIEPGGHYLHWDELRHRMPPAGLDVEQWWLRVAIARRDASRPLPLFGAGGRPLRVTLGDSMLRRLHFIDREAAGTILGLDADRDQPQGQEFLLRSLIEEAMTSAQLEGASTTREVAKEMLRAGRAPRDRGEQMIYNNYQVMRELASWREQPLTADRVFEIHRRLCERTFDDPSALGRLRHDHERIRVEDHRTGVVLHQPPPASELPQRLERLCAFANGALADGFVHPVVRAIAIHFQLAFDHPFVDGNGRTARALFYWSLLRAGYWLTEFLSISSVLRRAPAEYVRAFLHVETDDFDLGYFVDHQLAVLEDAVEGLRGYLARKRGERLRAERLLRPGSKLGGLLNHRQAALLADALRRPGRVYRIAEHQRLHGVVYQTARTDLLGLVRLELLDMFQQGKAYAFLAPTDLARRLGNAG
jgi:Fic family protein